MTTRTVSIEAVLKRAEARAKNSEQDALILQDDLITALQQVQQLTAELDSAKAKLAELEEKHGTS